MLLHVRDEEGRVHDYELTANADLKPMATSCGAYFVGWPIVDGPSDCFDCWKARRPGASASTG